MRLFAASWSEVQHNTYTYTTYSYTYSCAAYPDTHTDETK